MVSHSNCPHGFISSRRDFCEHRCCSDDGVSIDIVFEPSCRDAFLSHCLLIVHSHCFKSFESIVNGFVNIHALNSPSIFLDQVCQKKSIKG